MKNHRTGNNMKKTVIIEIGTNSIKALCAERNASGWKFLSDDLYPTRIGEGKAQTELLSRDGIQRSLRAIDAILHKQTVYPEPEIHIIATESLRSANNADIFINAVKVQSGLQVEILSGSDEAHYSFLAAASEACKTEETIAVLDIGGGSTELIIGRKNEVLHKQSYPIGAVKLTEKFIQNNPPLTSDIVSAKEFITAQIKDIGIGVSMSELRGVGGTVTTLALLSIPQDQVLSLQVEEAIALIDGSELSLEQISYFISKFSALTIKEKEMIPLMPKGRADIILAGTLILDEFMQALNLQKITVSNRGVRFGYLYSRCSQS